MDGRNMDSRVSLLGLLQISCVISGKLLRHSVL